MVSVLKRVICLMLTAIPVFLLSGCAGVGWHNPTKPNADYYRDKAQCELWAVRAYPIRMFTETTGTGYRTPVQTDCHEYGKGNTSCTTKGGDYIPPSTSSQDVNARYRALAQRNCVRSLGYKFQVFPDWLGGKRD